ncbi:MAG: hypothetical protein HRF49_07955 [bacterium]|jgi:hypothetical protein
MTKENIEELFGKIKKLLIKHSNGLAAIEKIPGSQAKGDKPGYHLYGKKEVALAGRKPQPTYVAGIIAQKHFVGFYSMPVYSHRNEFDFSPELSKMLKGKSCFNVTTGSPEILAEIESIIKKGIEIYKKEGWI